MMLYVEAVHVGHAPGFQLYKNVYKYDFEDKLNTLHSIFIF